MTVKICQHLLKLFLAAEDKGNNQPMLFYLWGHTFEFDRHNNWNVLENFAKKIGNRNDIWYATNIEIYDYVKGFNNLYFSYNNTIIYNPNAFDIWLTADEKPVKVSAGETIKL